MYVEDLNPHSACVWASCTCAWQNVCVCGCTRPHTIKYFLPYFLSWRHSCEKRYKALSHFSALKATESWAGPGNEARIHKYLAHEKYVYILCIVQWWGPCVLLYFYNVGAAVFSSYSTRTATKSGGFSQLLSMPPISVQTAQLEEARSVQ